MIPCEQCISLAICKSRASISCELLYPYLYDHILYEKYTEDEYREYRRKVNEIMKFFNKEGYSYFYGLKSKEIIIQWKTPVTPA